MPHNGDSLEGNSLENKIWKGKVMSSHPNTTMIMNQGIISFLRKKR
jgi:hypothetical protein